MKEIKYLVTPISTNVPLVFANLVTLERLKLFQKKQQSMFFIISPWIKDVIFPLADFGVHNSGLRGSLTKTSEILEEMSEKGCTIKVCTLDYFSEVLTYKNPYRLNNPIQRIEQAISNLEEIEVLRDFQQKGVEIHLNKNFHSKIIISSLGIYAGSFNFTLSGYYRNREDGYYIPNESTTRDDFSKKLKDYKAEFLTDESVINSRDLFDLTEKNKEVINETRKNFKKLMTQYENQSLWKTDKKISRFGII